MKKQYKQKKLLRNKKYFFINKNTQRPKGVRMDKQQSISNKQLI